ncbi:hypothetical protein MHYP_G00157900 [Metynnis hypsauchen]
MGVSAPPSEARRFQQSQHKQILLCEKREEERKVMKRGRKHRKTKQSTAPQEMKQERELSPPPSPPACTCFPKMSLFHNKDRKQERQQEEVQLHQLHTERRDTELRRKESPQKRKKERQMKMQDDKEFRDLEEAVRQLEQEIQGFRQRRKEMKRELKTLKRNIADVETKILNTRQTEEEWNREKQRQEERTHEIEEQRADICTEIGITVGKREMEEKKEQHDDGKTAAVSEQQEVMQEKKSEEELLPELEKQREEEWLKEDRERQEAVESRKEVLIEMENLEMEPAAPCTSRSNVVQRVLSSVLSSIRSRVQSIMEVRKKFLAPVVQAKEVELEETPPRPMVSLGAPTGVLTVHIRSCSDFSKTTRIQKGSQCMVRITVGDMVKCSMLQPFEENMTFNEVKHFSIEIQKEEALRVKKSISVMVELISFDGHSAASKLIGSTTIKLQEVLYKSSISQQMDLRLGYKKVCKLDVDLMFTYGSLGYGYSHQMKHPGRTMENLVKESLFPRCPPPEDRRDPYYNVITPCRPSSVNIMSSLMPQDAQRDRECRISAGVMDCMERRGRLSQLHKALEKCETGEHRMQLLESLILRTGTRSSAPSKTNQSSEVQSKEEEERKREENRKDDKPEEKVKKGKAKWKTRK